MTISIPETWLGEAAYPVLIDPVIGSNTIGAYRTFPYISPDDYEWYLDDLADDPGGTDIADYCEDMQFYLEEWMVLNRQTTPLALQGTYNAYLYADETWHYTVGSTTYYEEGIAYPMMYSGLHNKPKQILCSDTSRMVIKVSPSTPAKWHKGTLTFGTRINADTDIWFGFAGDMGIGCRFDYGSQYRGVRGFCPPDEGDYRSLGYNTIVEYISDEGYADVSGKPDYLCDSGSDGYNRYPGARFDFKISMYLELPAQQYTRTLTQGVTLTDNRKRVHGIVTKLLQTAGISGTNKRVQGAVRKRMETVQADEGHTRTHRAVRRTVQTTGINDRPIREKGMYRIIESLSAALETTGAAGSLVRAVYTTVKSFTDIPVRRDIRLGVTDSANQTDTVKRGRGVFAFLGFGLGSHDHTGYTNAWGRTVPDRVSPGVENRHIADYHRNPQDGLSGTGEALRRGAYIRKQQDTAHSEAVLLRHLFMFIRLITGAYIRDFIIRRFLKSREEVIIKSPVCRELTLDSKLR
jgi:hypothetical protein